jgi:putative ABC transport system permease protein
MLRNYLLVTLRNLIRNKTISLIHITGFGLGIAAFLFALQTVIFEFSFDNFHQSKNRIFNIPVTLVNQDGSQGHFLSSTPAIYHQIKAHMPEVQFVTRCMYQNNREPYCVVTYTEPNGKQKSFNELNARYVDEDFLKVFDFALLQGSREHALDGTSSLVVTQSIAQKYFGDDNPIGKVLEVRTGGPETRQTKFTYQVTGVLKDVPANSSLQFEILLPFRNFEENYNQDLTNIWYWPGFFTFIKTKDAEDPSSLKEKINLLIPKEEKESWAAMGKSFWFDVQPLTDLHLDSEKIGSRNPAILTNSKTYTLIIGLIGLAILIVAGVNYINLTTAKSLKRAKEVGIRKVIGASKSQLIRQFLLDAFFINSVGFLFALTLLQIGRPFIDVWSGHRFPLFSWSASQIALCIVMLLISVLLSGTIPAFFLSRVEPVKALSGFSLRSSGGGALRKGLVVFQFVVSVSLIVFTFVIFLQVEYMRSKDRGFETEQRVIIKNVGTEDFDFSKFYSFRERIQANPKVISVTAAMSAPGLVDPYSTEFATTDKPNELIRLSHNVVDYDFAKTLGLTIKAGREFTKDRMTGEKVIMINESAVTKLGYETSDEAVGKTISLIWQGPEGNINLKIIGVLKDFNSQSPGMPISPEVFMFAKTAWPYSQYNHFIAHIAPGQLQETIEFLNQEWKRIFPQAPFEYTFQDQAFQKVFERDERTQSIASLSTVLAIFIACMGLGGLVAFSVSQRIKEIGIRKILGASVLKILVILSGDFIRLIVLSIVLSIPVVWYVVTKFLENYKYRIEPSVWIFVIPCVLLLLIALVTISFQTLKAANANPVDSLRRE